MNAKGVVVCVGVTVAAEWSSVVVRDMREVLGVWVSVWMSTRGVVVRVVVVLVCWIVTVAAEVDV